MPFKKLQIKILDGQFKKLIELVGKKSVRIYSWYTEDLNNTTNYNDIIDIYQILHSTTAKYTFIFVDPWNIIPDGPNTGQ